MMCKTYLHNHHYYHIYVKRITVMVHYVLRDVYSSVKLSYYMCRNNKQCENVKI